MVGPQVIEDLLAIIRKVKALRRAELAQGSAPGTLDTLTVWLASSDVGHFSVASATYDKNKHLVLAHTFSLRPKESSTLAYLGTGWSCIPTFEVDLGLDIRNTYELGDLGVCHHFRLRFFEDTHGPRVSKQTPNLRFRQPRLFSNLCKGGLATGRNYIQNTESTNRVNADEVGDMEALID